MGLRDVVESVESERKTVTVYGPASLAAELDEYFAVQNVDVVHEEGDGPARAVVSDGEERLGEVDETALNALVAGPERGGDAPYAPLLDHLDDTTFTAYDRDQMLAATREIEDRAWRVGTGELHAGFQTLSRFERQRPVYERLAERGLDVRVYGEPDHAVADGPFRVYASDDPAVTETWFVVFGGGDDPSQRSALVALEREAGFHGFWTYDGGLVEDLLDALAPLRAGADGG